MDRDGKIEVLDPEDVLEMHKADKAWLFDELTTRWEGKTLVMTHHIPVPEVLAPESGKGSLAPAYASDLREEVLAHRIDTWVCGHSHWASRGTVEGLHGPITFTQNMQGYPDEETNFEPYRIIDTQNPGLGMDRLTIRCKELNKLAPAEDVVERLRATMMVPEL